MNKIQVIELLIDIFGSTSSVCVYGDEEGYNSADAVDYDDLQRELHKRLIKECPHLKEE